MTTGRGEWIRLAGGLCLFKVAYLGLLAGALWGWGDFDRFDRTAVRWPRTGPPVFGSHFGAWDAAHYLLLAEEGYAEGVPSDAFYPLWPLVLRFLIRVGMEPIPAGLLGANLASVLAWVLLHRLTRRRFGPWVAGWTLALLIAHPGSLFCQFPYSEGLFLLGLVLLLHGLERRQFVWAAVAAFSLPLTRAVGLFLVLPLLWHVVERMPAGSVRGPVAVVSESRSPGPTPFRGWCLLPAFPVMGWGTYLLLMGLWTGNPWEGIEAQRHWGRHSVVHLVDVPGFVGEFFRPDCWHGFAGSFLDRVMFLPVVFSLPALWRWNREWAVWAVVLGVLPAMSGGFTSYLRFAAMALPCFWLWAGAAGGRGPGRWAVVAVAGLGTIHAVLVWRFVQFEWAG